MTWTARPVTPLASLALRVVGAEGNDGRYRHRRAWRKWCDPAGHLLDRAGPGGDNRHELKNEVIFLVSKRGVP
jgi:hypothetical protein